MKYLFFVNLSKNKSKPSPRSFVKSILISGLLSLAVLDTTVSAASLQDLRASGALGESASGYVVARNASANADAARINKQRKALYAEKAGSKGVGPKQVGKIYALEIKKKVPAGTWLQNASGQWSQK